MDVATLRRAMAPTSVSDATLASYLPHFVEAMRAAEITTVRRVAAWCSQVGHESAGLRYMAEIKTSDPTWNWDRTRYRGRGPIQLTWQGNYRKFGQWCQAKGYVNDPELFVNQPELVEQPKWGFLAASWYWVNAGPKPGQINGFADAGDIYSVSRCVNGWRVDAAGNAVDPNGWNDNDGSRLPRWNRCLAIGDALLLNETPTTPEENVGVSGDPVWLEDVLRPALGDRLKTLPGWKTDGVGGTMGNIWGVIWHHTGNAAEKPESISKGRSDLPGPLAQIHIAPDGIVTIVAVGPCNHAGRGSWAGLPTDAANDRTIGIECAWPRDTTITEATQGREKWPDAQIISMRDVGAALTKHLGVPVSHNISHSEWARFGPLGWRQGKWDPGNLDMDWFRGEIQKDIDGFVFPGEPTGEQPPVDPVKVFPEDWTDREIAIETLRQQRGYNLDGWPQLDGMTVVDYLASLGAKVDRLLGDAS